MPCRACTRPAPRCSSAWARPAASWSSTGPGRTLTEDELVGLLPGVFGTIAGGEPYSERVFAAAPELRVVARMGVGYDKVDVAAATRHRVAIAMGFGTNHEAVADHAFALMAGLANRLAAYHQEVMEGRWGGHFQPGLWRTTVGIIGLGRIGRALARRCRGFDMRILAYDAVPDAGYAERHGIELVDLKTLFREADFVSVNAPLAPEALGG
jgi:D-3-phosphoglycerate dehydrogenase / 2-oxoglutarate reductase